MLELGRLRIDFPFLLAPMAGVTDMPFRILLKELGAGVVVSELISGHGVHHGSRKTLEMLRFDDRERPVGLQIFGHDAEVLGRAAREVERMGADFVDVNVGCPVPKVVRKGGGVAWMRDPSRLRQMLQTVRRSVTIPVTVKMRAGWDEREKNAIDCARAAADAGVAWIVIHGRTRSQGYQGQADWELIARCKEAAGVPVIGNGDVVTAAGAIDRLRSSGCDGIMIGRGVLRNPWIFEEIRALVDRRPIDEGRYDFVRLLRRHRTLLDEAGGGRVAAIHLRKFAAWYSHGYPLSALFRANVFRAATLDDVERLAVEFFERVRHIPLSQKDQRFFLCSGAG